MRIDTEADLIAVPDWRDASLGLPCDVPATLKTWLLTETSVTEKLGKTFGTGVTVKVLHDAPGRVLNDEGRLLRTRDTEAHVREVTLRCGDHPVVAARTVYASPVLREHHPLTELGSRPLGELLFANGPARWLTREFVALHQRMPLFDLVRRVTGDACSSCWARRTLFLLEGEPLLVTEIFLPAMLSPPGVASCELS